MNFTRKNKIILSVTAGVVAIAVIVTAVILTGGKTPLPAASDPVTSQPSSDVVVNLPTDDPAGTESPDPTGKEKDDALVIDVGGDSKDPTGTQNNGGGNPAKTPEKPVDTKKPEQPADNNGGGLVIGGGDQAGQDEQQAAVQAWLRNMELEGCPYCGSHKCPSFYALDEWGNPSLDVTLCPKYDERKDPIKYCQTSGKRTGDGTNGTCVRFVNACHCPNCGKYVEANTCHTCGE